MVHVTRIAGSPGAGKTHTLTQKLKRERDENNVGLTDFYAVTFTNASRIDMTDAVAELFDAPRDDIEGSVRTLHSVAWGQAAKAGLIEDMDDQVISQLSERGKEHDPYQMFCDNHAMRYKGRTLQYTREKGEDTGAGDTLFRLNEWLTYTQKDWSDAKTAPFTIPWNTSRAMSLLEKWHDFKRSAFDLPRIEHGDYLDFCIERELFPDADVLLLDEFQDFSPQEYLYYKLWRDSGKLDRIYLAGDPNQSIYSFRAGMPYYFRETNADNDMNLTDSHRCRGAIADYARTVLNCGPRDETTFSAVFDGGRVERVDGSRDDNLKAALDGALEYDDGVFILARTNRKVDSIQRWLHEHGYPYRRLGRRSGVWRDSLVQSLDALRRLAARRGGVDRTAVNTLMAHAPQNELRKDVLDGHGDVYSVESVWSAFRDQDTIGGIVETLDYKDYERSALRTAAANAGGNDPVDLSVGTIHAAKGLERPAVLLFNSFNGHIDDQYNKNMDVRAEEHRIAYVGVSRAEKRLSVVDDFFSGPEMKPLRRARASGGV